MKKTLYIFAALIFCSFVGARAGLLDKATIILGRPTNNSITYNVLAKTSLEFYVEYGTASGSYSKNTGNYSSQYPEPVVFKLENLEADKKYYYRVMYKETSSGSFTPSEEFTFHTQRAKGSTFSFTIEADPHLYDKKGCASLMKICLNNQLKDQPDFILDLGDTFGDDHNPTTVTEQEVKQLRLNYLPYFGMICHSSPLFFCLGNHEGESGYNLLQTPPNNLATYATRWRLKYYPNPYQDGFYTGINEEEPGLGNPQNYYAWEWGDALFVVMDVYRYATANEKPQGWDWTLGEKQYQWFRSTLVNSKAKYKFVFAHHMLGQRRGGLNNVALNEWGGWKDAKKVAWEFDTKRPGWDKPIHQLMVDNGVNVFFQGHDHVYATELVDGMIYHEIPIPCDSTYEIGYLANADAYTGRTLDGAGHIRVTVNPDQVKVDYVKAYLAKDETDSLKNAMIGDTYVVKSKTNIVETDYIPTSIKITPNPVSDFLKISVADFNPGSSINVIIFNVLGEQVCEMPLSEEETLLNVKDFPSGTYNIIINNAGKITLKKIVKIK